SSVPLAARAANCAPWASATISSTGPTMAGNALTSPPARSPQRRATMVAIATRTGATSSSTTVLTTAMEASPRVYETPPRRRLVSITAGARRYVLMPNTTVPTISTNTTASRMITMRTQVAALGLLPTPWRFLRRVLPLHPVAPRRLRPAARVPARIHRDVADVGAGPARARAPSPGARGHPARPRRRACASGGTVRGDAAGWNRAHDGRGGLCAGAPGRQLARRVPRAAARRAGAGQLGRGARSGRRLG